MNEEMLNDLLAQFADEEQTIRPAQHDLITTVTVIVVGVTNAGDDGLPAWQVLGNNDWVMV